MAGWGLGREVTAKLTAKCVGRHQSLSLEAFGDGIDFFVHDANRGDSGFNDFALL